VMMMVTMMNLPFFAAFGDIKLWRIPIVHLFTN
jgi:hypothetical protein